MTGLFHCIVNDESNTQHASHITSFIQSLIASLSVKWELHVYNMLCSVL